MKNSLQNLVTPNTPKIATIALWALLSACTATDDNGNCYEIIGSHCPDDTTSSDVDHYPQSPIWPEDHLGVRMNLLNSPNTKVIDISSGQVLTTISTDNYWRWYIDFQELSSNMNRYGLNEDSLIYITSTARWALELEWVARGIRSQIFSITEINDLLDWSVSISKTWLVASRAVIKWQEWDYYTYEWEIDSQILNQRITAVDQILKDTKIDSQLQLASFHPEYQFEGTDKDAASNFTNRSPYPIIHILRVEEVERAITLHEDTDAIPARNIALMEDYGLAYLKKQLSKYTEGS